MANRITEDRDTHGLATLVKDIITDAQELTRQQIDLFKVEMQSNFEKAKGISILLASSVTLGIVAGIVLAIAAGQFLAWAFPVLPEWGGHAIVGGLLAVTAGILFGVCKQQLDSYSVLPKQTVEAVKENLEWKTDSR